jgi:hypothetical protein
MYGYLEVLSDLHRMVISAVTIEPTKFIYVYVFKQMHKYIYVCGFTSKTYVFMYIYIYIYIYIYMYIVLSDLHRMIISAITIEPRI